MTYVSERVELESVLASRRWWHCTDPFPHFVANDVFKRPVYEAMEEAFQEILDRGFADDRDHMSKRMRGYDAYGLQFPPDLTGPLHVFITRAWHDMLASLVGVNATGHINSGLHHHQIGSDHGTVHHDLNPGWFVDYDSGDDAMVSRHELCSYGTGRAYVEGVTPRETMRAVAMIFYVNNPLWSPGDGGETGLYRTKSDPVDQPAARVPPINNSLLVFQCTPFSHHSFISNVRHPRNSVIMWLHRPKDEVLERWGERPIGYWGHD